MIATSLERLKKDGESQSGLGNAPRVTRNGFQIIQRQSQRNDKLPDEDWEQRRILSGVESPPGSPGIDQAALDLRSANGVESNQTGQSSDDSFTQLRRNDDRIPSINQYLRISIILKTVRESRHEPFSSSQSSQPQSQRPTQSSIRTLPNTMTQHHRPLQ